MGEKKHSYLLSAPTMAHHTLRSMHTTLTRTCRKTRQQAKTHTCRRTLPCSRSLSLCSAGSQQQSQSVRFFYPPTSFLPGSHVCLALPSVLHAVEHRAASGCRTSTRWQECLVEFYKNEKQEEK